MEKITANFTFDELIYSPTANRLGIDNTGQRNKGKTYMFGKGNSSTN